MASAGDATACASAAGAAAPAFGLVHSSTSDKELVVDRLGSRYRRLKKSVLTSARLLMESMPQQGFRYFLVMLTLTYAPGVQWSAYHITTIQKSIREWLRARGHRYAYVWVCELQKRGVPHYHVVVWLPRGLRLPKPDLCGWWPHGMSNIQKVSKPIGYLMKYLSKTQGDIARFRKGQRTHGSGGLESAAKKQRRWWLAPSYVRQRWPSHSADVAPAKGGGWVSRESGEWMASPWRFVGFSPYGVVVRWIAGPRIGEFSTGERECQPNQK